MSIHLPPPGENQRILVGLDYTQKGKSFSLNVPEGQKPGIRASKNPSDWLWRSIKYAGDDNNTYYLNRNSAVKFLERHGELKWYNWASDETILNKINKLALRAPLSTEPSTKTENYKETQLPPILLLDKTSPLAPTISETSPPKMSKTETHIEPTTAPKESIPKTEYVAQPGQPLPEELQRLIARYGENSLTGKIIKLYQELYDFNKTRLPWDSNFKTDSSSQNYVDSIRPQDMRYPVMWGLDDMGAPFVSVKTVQALHAEGNPKSREFSEAGVETFTRFRDDLGIWYSTGHFPKNHPRLGSLSGPEKKAFEEFEKLLRGETIQVKPYDIKLASS